MSTSNAGSQPTGFVAFWTSLPGILAACVSVLSIGGFVAVDPLSDQSSATTTSSATTPDNVRSERKASSSMTSCGSGLSVNDVTSCPFARRVRTAFEAEGASTISVYSPVTKTTYTMMCQSGVPTVCRGGNNAVVYIR